MTFAAFGGDRTGTAPLTWGQRAIWKSVEAMAPNHQWLNIRRMIRIPPQREVDVAAAVAAMGRLLTRHETLRTRIRLVDGEPHQDLGCTGQVPVEVVEASAAASEAAEALLERLAVVPFDFAEEWPIRAGLVVAAGRVRHVVLVISHVATDWHATEVIVRDLRRLLFRGGRPDAMSGPPEAPRGLRPLDLARREQTQARCTERARDHWTTGYRRLPAQIFTDTGHEHRPRYAQVRLTSRALTPALELVAARHEVSTSTVLLAAMIAVMAAHSGHSTCGLVTIVDNRYQPGHADIVAPMNQLGLVVLDVSGSDPADPASLHLLLPRAWQAALLAYRHAYYDQGTLDRELIASGRGGEADVDPYCCFNDLRARAGKATATDPTGLSAALAGTTVDWTYMDAFNWRCYLEAHDVPDGLRLVLMADTRYLPTDRMERFVRDMEGYVVGAATL